MNNRSLRLILLTLTLLKGALSAVTAQDKIDTSTTIFDSSIRSLTVNIEGNRIAPPVLTLDGTDRLIIGFDILGEDRNYLRYSIIHCSALWQPEELVDAEVFDGFNYADINDYTFSRGTTTHYVHYNITLPNDEYRFRISGNYLLRVYPEDDPDYTMLQVRFMVQEGAVNVGGSITTSTDIDYNASHQQLSLDIDTRNTYIRDPNTDLRIVVAQNGREDNRVILDRPSRMMGTRLIYEHIPALIFPAGNEYRRIETVNNLYPGMGVDHIEFHAPRYYHIVNTDKPRVHRPYQYDSTQHGRYFIREYNSDNSDAEADYVLTLFTLDMLRIPDGDVYLDGDFMLRRFDSTSRMEYNPEELRYEKLLLLKQGAYNYQYLFLPDGSPRAFTAPIEGDHYQTVNEYTIYVYYRAPGDRYDRLLGFGMR
ncbi:MAG: DUF5103 domain-containing protein [Muribaculaceae bacterium]|nr:DUF5103 domain-containing protein [Muribaculaceae bacterium]